MKLGYALFAGSILFLMGFFGGLVTMDSIFGPKVIVRTIPAKASGLQQWSCDKAELREYYRACRHRATSSLTYRAGD